MVVASDGYKHLSTLKHDKFFQSHKLRLNQHDVTLVDVDVLRMRNSNTMLRMRNISGLKVEQEWIESQ